MKLPLLALCVLAAFLAGCDSMSSRVQERFTPVPPHTKVFSADQKSVYYAAQLAVKKAGLLLGHTSVANWSVAGYAPIHAGDATSDTRQTTIEIRLSETGENQTEVAVLVWDHTEGKFPGGVSEQAFREHGLYDAYFAALEAVLQDDGAPKSDTKP